MAINWLGCKYLLHDELDCCTGKKKDKIVSVGGEKRQTERGSDVQEVTWLSKPAGMLGA